MKERYIYYDGSPELSAVEMLSKQRIEEKFWEYITKKISLSQLVRLLKEDLERTLLVEFSELNVDKPPVHIERVDTVGKIPVMINLKDECMPFQATTQVTEDGIFSISVSSVECTRGRKVNIGRNRIRSSVAHELMHTFFYDKSKKVPRRLGEHPRDPIFYKAEEDICRHLARVALLPKYLVDKEISNVLIKQGKFCANMENLLWLENKFEVAPDLITWRLFRDLGIWKGVFFRLTLSSRRISTDSTIRSPDSYFARIVVPRIPNENTFLGEMIIDSIKDMKSKESADVTIVKKAGGLQLELYCPNREFMKSVENGEDVYFVGLVSVA